MEFHRREPMGKLKNQFVSEIWTYKTEGEDNEWRNTGHEPTVATGYDVDLLRGLRFTGHVCADKKETAFPFQEMPPSPFLLFMKDRR